MTKRSTGTMRRATPRIRGFSLFSLSLLLSMSFLVGEIANLVSPSDKISSFSMVRAEEDKSQGSSGEAGLFQEAPSGGMTRTIEIEEEGEKEEEKHAAKEEEQEGVPVTEETGVGTNEGQKEANVVASGDNEEIIPLEDISKRASSSSSLRRRRETSHSGATVTTTSTGGFLPSSPPRHIQPPRREQEEGEGTSIQADHLERRRRYSSYASTTQQSLRAARRKRRMKKAARIAIELLIYTAVAYIAWKRLDAYYA
ncbi:hypothetical protein CSUI_002704, partial [Cystoisospora suis]